MTVVSSGSESTEAATVPDSVSRIGEESAAPGWESFAVWASQQLDCELYSAGKEWMVIRESEELADSSEPVSKESGSRWRRNLAKRIGRKKNRPASPQIEYQSDDSSQLLKWLLDSLAELDHLPRLVPAEDPQSVHAFADRLFGAYKVEGGSVHMAGCHLEDRSFLRLSRVEKTASEPKVAHRYFDTSGEEVEQKLAEQLCLTSAIEESEHRLPAVSGNWAQAVRVAKEGLGVSGPTWRASGLVLAKYARGNLRITISSESLDVPFVGWTRTLEAPAAKCPETGVSTFHFDALADGRIVAAEQVVRCEVSQKKILRTEAVVCNVTSQRVDPALCRDCPVTGKPALEAKFASCPCCKQEVSQIIIGSNGCAGCLARKSVNREDERLKAALAVAPKLSDFKRFKLAETRSAIIVETGGWRTRLLVVIDKATGQLVHAAARKRLSRTWATLTDAEKTEQIG